MVRWISNWGAAVVVQVADIGCSGVDFTKVTGRVGWALSYGIFIAFEQRALFVSGFSPSS